MKILVLSRKRTLYSTRRLKQEGERRGHVVEIVDPLRCVLVVSGGRPSVLFRGKPLSPPDVVLPRVGTAGIGYSIAVVRHFELMKVPVVNRYGAIARAKNKLCSLQLLARAGIRIPDTLISRYPRDLDRLMKLVGGAPVIMKLLRGTQGMGVVLAETPASVISMLETVWSLGEDILLQRFIAESRGKDLRALVIDGKVRVAMRRVAAKGEFRSNIHRGAVGEKVRLAAEYQRVAVAAAKTMGLRLAGVDMLETSDGPLVIEVNASPGIRGMEGTTGENVAKMFVDSAVRVARERRRGEWI